MLLLTVAPSLSGTALAERQFPASARYGELQAFQYPQARIGGKTLRLGPGARIHGEQNLIIMPGAVPSKADVLYRVDLNGDVLEMWLLTPEEAAVAKRMAGKSTAPATAPR
jgi:hypothetical protein